MFFNLPALLWTGCMCVSAYSRVIEYREEREKGGETSQQTSLTTQKAGAPVIDSDKAAHVAYQRGTELYTQIVSVFGARLFANPFEFLPFTEYSTAP